MPQHYWFISGLCWADPLKHSSPHTQAKKLNLLVPSYRIDSPSVFFSSHPNLVLVGLLTKYPKNDPTYSGEIGPLQV